MVFEEMKEVFEEYWYLDGFMIIGLNRLDGEGKGLFCF